MSATEILPTVLIETPNGAVLINKSDFDASVHKLAGKKVELSSETENMKKVLLENGVSVPDNITEKKLKKLYDEFQQTQKSNKLSVVEENGKFLIKNEIGENVGAEEFDSKEVAEEMLKLLTGV